MKEILTFFNNNLWLNITSFVIGIVGILMSLLFYIKSKKDKRPVFSKQTYRLIQKNTTTLKKLKVLCNDKQVEKLTLTKFAFWNADKETIRRIDIAANNPIVIMLHDQY